MPETETEPEGRIARSYPTVGVDATDLLVFDDVETAEGDRLVYDAETEDAWIQSDVYADRADLV